MSLGGPTAAAAQRRCESDGPAVEIPTTIARPRTPTPLNHLPGDNTCATPDAPDAQQQAPPSNSCSSTDDLAAARAAAALELEALLQLKAAIDDQNILDWSERRAASEGYCGAAFRGITCDPWGRVKGINLNDEQLEGTLPPAAVLRKLARLVSLQLFSAQLRGTLPASWGELSLLEVLRIGKSRGLSGTLPKEWAGMVSLKTFHLT